MSSWIESMYSCSSLIGFVSSKRRWQRPPNSSAIPKLSAIAFGCPMWRYPFGSGGKRVTTCETLPLRTSAATISRIKSLRSEVAGLWALAPLLLISRSVVQCVATAAGPACGLGEFAVRRAFGGSRIEERRDVADPKGRRLETGWLVASDRGCRRRLRGRSGSRRLFAQRLQSRTHLRDHRQV